MEVTPSRALRGIQEDKWGHDTSSLTTGRGGWGRDTRQAGNITKGLANEVPGEKHRVSTLDHFISSQEATGPGQKASLREEAAPRPLRCTCTCEGLGR